LRIYVNKLLFVNTLFIFPVNRKLMIRDKREMIFVQPLFVTTF